MHLSLAILSFALALAPQTGITNRVSSRAASKPGTAFVIGVSPFLARTVKDEVYRSIVRLLVEDLPLESSVSIYDAYNMKSVARFELPDRRAFASPKTRANRFGSGILALKRFLAQDPPKPIQAHLDFKEALLVPQFCDFLVENPPGDGRPIVLLLIGSPLYEDPKEPGFSMVDGFFPSDGHLLASRDQSVFGFDDQTAAKRPMTVFWTYFGDPWINDLYQERVTRFWSLYLKRRDCRLVALSGDLATVVREFSRGAQGRPGGMPDWKVDPHQTKIEMLRISRKVEVADWLLNDGVPEALPPPPRVTVGRMKIGIRWKDNIDLDLYATPNPGAETLFFQHPRSPRGFYYKDHRSSPGREFEFIEFEKPVDIHKVQAFVNFYGGTCPGGPRGEVRIEFDNRIYRAAFSITASHGNEGRAGAGQSEWWTRIPVQQILLNTP